MTHIVFVPGTMGSELVLPSGEVVWPPTVPETQFGYGRIDKLLDPSLRVRDIVRAVWCVGIYGPLVATLDRMGFKETGAKPNLTLFAYDWRLDLEVLAGQLATRLGQVAARLGPDEDIAIVAHSMGGLIARLVLETGAFSAEPWFGRVRMLTTLGTPHLGAPLALARILGLDSAMGISGADFRRMASDRRYPSGYQLLPPDGEAPCWDVAGTGPLAALSIFDPAVATRLRLDKPLLKRAQWVHGKLAKGKRPAHVRYFQFAGVGHSTATRVNVGTATMSTTLSADAGDGTVPLWSAAPLAGQKQTVPGNHSDFFTNDIFKAVFYRLFGKSFPTPPLGLAAVMTLSVADLVLAADRPVEVALNPADPVSHIAGRLTVQRTETPEAPWMPFRADAPLTYDGPPTRSLVVTLPPMGQRGLYRIGFEGTPTMVAPAMFAALG